MKGQEPDKHIANDFLKYFKFINALRIQVLVYDPNTGGNIFHSFKKVLHKFL